MKHAPLKPCPLCKSPDVKAYQVGWAVIHCKGCYLSISRAMPLRDLVEIWNKRESNMADAGTVKPTRPVLRYHGGKWMIGKWIISHFPSHRIYVEPFGGAASVLMQKDRSFMEVYNDMDDDIVNMFQVLRDPKKADRLCELLRLTPWSRVEFVNSYKPVKEPIERSRRTIVRAFMAFGTTSRRQGMTGFRGKAERKNNTGINDWFNYPSSLAAVVDRLKGVLIEHRPALEVIEQQDDEETLF